MARDGKKLQHIHSSVPNKQPKPEVLELGELAVNNAAGNEFISTKNSEGKVVRFSSDNKVLSIIENKTVMPYKGEVVEPTEQDLLDNKSQIVIGLNQVATKNTFGYDQVNGATDMHGNEINPSEDGGKTNGAGFAINMDRYAMIGANPSFKSVTVPEIKSDTELFIGNNKELDESNPMPEISVYGSSVKIHANDGKVGITSKGDINISGEQDGNFNVENDMCIGAGNEMKIGAVEKITIGEDCSGTETGVVEIKGAEVVIKREPTNNLSATTVEGALEELADKVSAAGDGYITGGHVDSGSGIINVEVLGQPGATIDGLEEYINNKLGDISGIAKRSEVTKETIDEEPKIVISFFDKDDNELEDLQIVLDDYYNKGEIEDMELVIAAALTDLDDRLLTVSGDVTDLKIDVEELKNKKDNFVTDGNVDEDTGIIYLNRSESDEPAEVTGLSEYITSKVGSLSGDTFVSSGYVNTNTGIIKLIKNDGTEVTPISGLPEYVNGQTDGLVKDVEYTTSGGTKVIVFKDKDGDVVRIIDATEFIKDGMVDSVSIGVPTSGQHAGEDCLIITWNTYAGKDTTEIPLSMFFNPAVLEGYYTKVEVNTMLGENFALDLYSGDNFSSITQVILKDELVTAAALNDLNSRVSELDSIKLDKTDDSYVEGGHVDSGSGIINLSVKNKGNVEVGGLAEYIGSKIGSASADTYVETGSVNTNTGIITLVKNDNTEIPVSGLAEYVSGATEVLINEAVSGIQTSITNINNNVNIVSGDTITGGSVAATSLILNKENGETITIPGLPTPGSTIKDGVVSAGTIDNDGNIILERTEGLPNVVISGFSEYIDSIDKYITGGSCSNGTLTLNLSDGNNVSISGIGSGVDTYVSGGTVGNNGVITLNLTNGETATVTGLATYVSNHDDDNFVTGGTVGNNGVITLNLTNGETATVTGLAAYVSGITPPIDDVWVDTTGDTMTGNLEFVNENDTRTLLINANQGNLVTEGSIVTHKDVRADSGFSTTFGDYVTTQGSVLAREGSIEGKEVIVGMEGSSAADAHLDVYGPVNVYHPIYNASELKLNINPYANNGESVLTVSGDTTVERGNLYVSGGTNGVYAGDGFHYYSPSSSGHNSNSYVLLAGGGVKPLSDFNTEGGGTVEGDKYLESATINNTTGVITFGVHEGDPVELNGLGTYVTSKAGEVANYVASGISSNYLPLEGGVLNSSHGDHTNPVLKINGDSGSTSGTPILSVNAKVTAMTPVDHAVVTERTIATNGRVLANGFVHEKYKDNYPATEPVGVITLLNAYGGTYQLITGQTIDSGIVHADDAINIYSGTAVLNDSVRDMTNSLNNLSGKTDEVSAKTDNNIITIHDLETGLSGLNLNFTEFSGNVKNDYATKSEVTDAVKDELSGGSKTYLDSIYASTSSVNDLSGSIADLNGKTDEVSAKTDNNIITIHDLETGLSGLNLNFTEFSGNVKNDYATKSEVTDAVKDELSGGSKTYLDSTYATTSSVNDLNGSINNLNSTVNEVSGKTDSNTITIHGLETDFSGLNHSFTEFSGNVKNDYATKSEVTDAVKDEISGGSKTYLDATYATTSSVNDLSGDIADLRTSATTNANDIISLNDVVGNNFNTLNNKFSEYATSASVESNYVKQDKLADGVKETLSADTATRNYLNDTYVSNNNLNNAIATSTTITNMQTEVDSKLSNGETIVVSAGTASNMTGSTVASDKIEFVNGNDSTTIDASGVDIKDGLNEMLFNESGITFANVNSNPRIIFTGGTWVERSGVTAPNANISAITSNDITTDELEATSARTTNLTANTENVDNLYVGGINGPVVAELKAGTPNGTFSFSGSVKSTGGFVYNNSLVSGSTNHVLLTNGSYLSLDNVANRISDKAAFTGTYVQREGDTYLESTYKTTGNVSANTIGATNLVVDGGNVTVDGTNVSIETNVYSVNANVVGASEYHLGGSGSGPMEFYGYNYQNPSLTILDPSQYGSNGTIVKLINSKMSLINGHDEEVGYIMTDDYYSKISATTVYTSNGSVQTSDSRLKENVSSISDEAIANVAKVDLKSFNMIGDKDKTVKYGVIAQELNDVGLTNVTKEGPDGYYGVDYTSFLILKIAQLEKKIKDLEEKLK